MEGLGGEGDNELLLHQSRGILQAALPCNSIVFTSQAGSPALGSGALLPWEHGGMLEPEQREGLAGRRVCFGGCRKERVLVSHYRP